MSTVTLEEAQARLPDLVAALAPGEDVVITCGNLPVARLVAEQGTRPPRQPGNCKGMLAIVAEDDEHLRDFAEYMQ